MPKIRKKRPCCICRRWFTPRPQARKTQVTCGHPECQREKHRRQCRKWNRRNKDYFRSNYMEKKLEAHTQNKRPPPATDGIVGKESTTETRISIPKVLSGDSFLSGELFLILEYLIKAHIFRFNQGKKKRHDPG